LVRVGKRVQVGIDLFKRIGQEENPMPIRKRPLTMLMTLMYRFILSKAERNELKARDERKKGIPRPTE